MHHQRRARPDGRRPHRRGRRALPGPGDDPRRGLESASPRSCARSPSACRTSTREAIAEGNRKQATVPRGRRRCSSRSAPPRARRAPAEPAARADGRRAAGTAARAAADVGAAIATEAMRGAIAGRDGRIASGCCACSGSRSPRSPRRCGWPNARASSSQQPGGHDLPETRRGRGGDALRARRRGRLRRVRGGGRAAPHRHAVLRPTADGRRAGGRPAARPAARRRRAARSRRPSPAPAGCWRPA